MAKMRAQYSTTHITSDSQVIPVQTAAKQARCTITNGIAEGYRMSSHAMSAGASGALFSFSIRFSCSVRSVRPVKIAANPSALLAPRRKKGIKSLRKSPATANRTRRGSSLIDFRRSLRQIYGVGLECSRPAFPRHFAQVLHFARLPGEGCRRNAFPLQYPDPGGAAWSKSAREGVHFHRPAA